MKRKLYTRRRDGERATESPLDGSKIAYIRSPLHTHNSLRVNGRDCFHPGIFRSGITKINKNQSINLGSNCLIICVIQCLRFYNACDLYTIIYHDHAPAKAYGSRIYAIMLPSSGFLVVQYTAIPDTSSRRRN